MKTLLSFGLCLSLFASLASCDSKDNSTTSNKARLQVRLTDDPANYDGVFIDVQDVRVNYSSDTASGWQSLANVQRGTYDILRLVNDKDTLLGDAELNSGRIQQIRLVLGPNNYVRVNGQNYPLETPSAQQSGLKINIHQDVTAGVLYTIVLDFDAARSIHKTGNGKFMLKPVIRATLKAAGGSIRGYVLPNTFPTAVFAIQGSDTVAGTLTSGGAYTIKGLNAGSYQLSFAPSDTTYKSASKPSVTVSGNNITTVDTVRLTR